jgi:hypothetical protein
MILILCAEVLVVSVLEATAAGIVAAWRKVIGVE